jgi:hypothetical protein
MSETRTYPEDAQRAEVLWTLTFNEGMANFMWKYITGQKPRLPFNKRVGLRYAEFVNENIRHKTAEEIGTLLITIQDFIDAVPQYTDEDFSQADFTLREAELIHPRVA